MEHEQNIFGVVHHDLIEVLGSHSHHSSVTGGLITELFRDPLHFLGSFLALLACGSVLRIDRLRGLGEQAMGK
jgi:hypothetical protein